MKLRDLRYSLHAASDTRHPQVVMSDLGIKRVLDVPQSIADQWWFLGCENVPDVLPEFIKDMLVPEPHDLVGYGLSVQMADRLVAARQGAENKHEEAKP